MTDPVDLTPAPQRRASETLLRSLLPRFYWLRDFQAGGGTLDALIAALATEYAALRAEIDGLYDNVFLQTCAPELVPYFGDGVGVTGLAPAEDARVSDRAWIGRITGFRQTKGTLATLARACTAATAWQVFIQDGRTVSAHTQSMAFPRPAQGRLAAVSGGGTPGGVLLDDVDAPSSGVTRGVSFGGSPMRAGTGSTLEPTTRSGHPAPLTLDLAVWRLQSFWVSGGTAKQVEPSRGLAGRAFTFDPTGRDTPLFAVPDEVEELAEPPPFGAMPAPLTMASLRDALAADADAGGPPVSISTRQGDDALDPISHGAMAAADLSGWSASFPKHAHALVDPLRGRLLLHERASEVRVSYAYGFAGEIGGGPYGVALQFGVRDPRASFLYVRDSPDSPREENHFRTLHGALAKVDDLLREDHDCYVVIDDSTTQQPSGRWPQIRVPDGRTLQIVGDPESAPVLEGPLEVQVDPGGRFELCSLTAAGSIRASGDGQIAVAHCTLTPAHDLSLHIDGKALVTITNSVVGAIRAPAEAWLSVVNSATGAIGLERDPVGHVDLKGVTVLGTTDVGVLVAEDCIFTRRVVCTHRDSGMIQSSYVAPGSSPPHTLLACQPGDSEPPVKPLFSSTTWGDPAFCQLQLRCPPQIASGATHAGEMGVWNWLEQPTRFARMAIVVDEMLPAGVAASVQYRN